jgi:hypothetical protein
MQNTRKGVAAVAIGLLLSLTALGSSAFASDGPGATAKTNEAAVKKDAAPNSAADAGSQVAKTATADGQSTELTDDEMQQVTGQHIVIRHRGGWETHLPSPKVCLPFVGCASVHRHPK